MSPTPVCWCSLMKRPRLRSKCLFPARAKCPPQPGLSLRELTRVWTLGVGSDRSLGRPKDWNGESGGSDDFAFKFSGLPGDDERDFWKSLQTCVSRSCGQRWQHEKRSWREVLQLPCELWLVAKLWVVSYIILRIRTCSRTTSLAPQREKLVCWKEGWTISLLPEWISVIGFSSGWILSVCVNEHVVAWLTTT